MLEDCSKSEFRCWLRFCRSCWLCFWRLMSVMRLLNGHLRMRWLKKNVWRCSCLRFLQINWIRISWRISTIWTGTSWGSTFRIFWISLERFQKKCRFRRLKMQRCRSFWKTGCWKTITAQFIRNWELSHFLSMRHRILQGWSSRLWRFLLHLSLFGFLSGHWWLQ